MRELEYKEYLESAEEIKSKNKAIKSRISRAYKAEDILGCSLDEIVIDDDRMYDALQQINHDSRENNGNIQNAVRWYYKFANGKTFPRLTAYRKQ